MIRPVTISGGRAPERWLTELGGGPAGGAAVAVLQGAERLTEDRGHTLTGQVVQVVRVGRGVVVLLRAARVPDVERGGGPNGLVGRRIPRPEGLTVGNVRREVRAAML